MRVKFTEKLHFFPEPLGLPQSGCHRYLWAQPSICSFGLEASLRGEAQVIQDWGR